MRVTTTYDVPSPPDEVASYLANPRNLVSANHAGPIVDQSPPPMRSGSWFVLAFDQLRVRVEYTTFDPPTVIAVSLRGTGPGSAGMHGDQVYRLAPTPDSTGTRITLDADMSGGCLPGPLKRLLWRRSLGRMTGGMDDAARDK